MKFFILVIFFAFSFLAKAENTPLLKCQVKNRKWTADFIVDVLGHGSLNFKKNVTKDVYSCELKVTGFNYLPNHISPHLQVEFERQGCIPKYSDLDADVFKTLTLTIRLGKTNQYMGAVQWLRKSQPDDCKVQKLELAEISEKSKKWK